MNDKQHYYRYELSLTLKPPFLSKKVGAQQFGYDMSMLKDADNYPVFLGSQIRGNLRHALQHFQALLKKQGEQPKKLAELEQVLALFGDASDKNNPENPQKFDPIRAQLNFAYYWQLSEADKQKSVNNEPRYRIGIDKEKGTVKKGNLQVIENVFKTGSTVDFCGQIFAQLNEQEAKITEYWLNKAAQFIPALGALKGTGFGKIKTAILTYSQLAKTETNSDIPENTERFGIVLTLDRPFCIAQAHLSDSNRFVSREFIAGNVLLGAIANHYLHKSEQENNNSWFNKIRITHALAAPQNTPCRTAVLPLSLAFFKDEPKDLAFINPREQIFLYKKDGKLLAPEFAPDWKDMDKAKQAINNCKLSFQRQLVVHTAIKQGTVQADDGKLFSLECIDPKQDVWCADVDLSQLETEERKKAIELFKNVISGGIKGIGKTKACASVKIQEAFTKTPVLNDKYHVITLQTDARLFAPHQIKATNKQDELFKLYKAYWKTASNELLTLSHYYAQQTRIGGQFYWRYYQKNQAYQPQWVTNAGSVFVLEKTDKVTETESEIQALLTDWQLHGLPQAEDQKDSNWENNPLIRENGFGEVLINADIHQQLKVNHGEGVIL